MPFTDPMADGPAVQASSAARAEGRRDHGQGARAGAQVPQDRQQDADRADGLLQSHPCLWHGALRARRGGGRRRRPDHRRSAAGGRRGAARARPARRASTSIRLVTPTTDDARLQRSCSTAPAAIFIMSPSPASPAPRASPKTMSKRALARIKAASALPGRGGLRHQRRRHRPAQIARIADAAVVGSAIVDVDRAAIWTQAETRIVAAVTGTLPVAWPIPFMPRSEC